MRSKYAIYLLGCFCVALLTACQETELGAEGVLRLNVGWEDQVKVSSRALTNEVQSQLRENSTVDIYSGKGKVRHFDKISALPEQLYLSGGTYEARVVAGDSVPASFEKAYYKGNTSFNIVAGQTTSIDVTCGIVNTLVSVAFDEGISTVFQNYKVTVANAHGALNFNSDSPDAIGYYMLDEGETTLKWTLDAELPGGASYQREGTLPEVKGATRYDLSFSFDTEDYQDGGGSISVSVNATPLEIITDEVKLQQRPIFKGDGFDLTEPKVFELHRGEDISLTIVSSSLLSEVTLSCKDFPSWGNFGSRMNLMQLTAVEKDRLAVQGLESTSEFDLATGFGKMTITLTAALVEKITAAEGSYDIQIHATDSKEKSNAATLSIVASNAVVITKSTPDAEVWSSKATLYGAVMKETSDPLSFLYRMANTSDEWTEVVAARSGQVFSAEISGLAAGVKYEYKAKAGSFISSQTYTFVTEAKAQLPNAGFENWHSSQPMYVYESGGSMFWDTGNHGSAKAKADITVYDESLKHGGSRSAKLESKFASIIGIGQFAAGNVFTGKYLDTKMSGTTGNGVLGWGRPFTSRPTALHGYVRYISSTVNYDNNCEFINNGDADQGQIYIVLGDWKGEVYNGETWPVVVKTNYKTPSSAQLFDAGSADIIAYGEKTFAASTEGEDLVEFTIPIDYRTLSRKPTHIIIVASSSKYGDYFSGGVGSTMWLDDIELIYE